MGLSVIGLGELAVRLGYPPVYAIAGTSIVAAVIVLSRMGPESSTSSHRAAKGTEGSESSNEAA